MDCSLPASSVHGDSLGKNTWVGCQFLLQGIFPTQESNPGILHCRQILYQLSYEGSRKNYLEQWKCYLLSCIWVFATPWTVACWAPLSRGFSRQEYCSGLPFPSPGDLPNQGSNLHLLHWQGDSLLSDSWGKPTIKALQRFNFIISPWWGHKSTRQETDII